MAPSKIRKALGAMKDQTSIGLAKASSSATLAELEVAIVKATRHDEYPAEEKHVREIISLTSYSRANVAASVALLSRRLGKTRSWSVALKALVVIHRLLADGDPAFEQEVFFATRRGTRMLNMADFRDAAVSRSGRWDFSAFVRTYARYLDERLEYKMQGRRCRGGVVAAVSPGRMEMVIKEEEEEEEGESGRVATPPRSTPVKEMRTERLLGTAQHLQRLLDLFLACRPTGAAKENKVVAMALYPIVKESFHIYLDLSEIVATFVDRFMELPLLDCTRVHDLFSKLSKQFEELDAFHSWSRSTGVARSSDYPDIEHITHKKLQVIEGFIRDRSDSRSIPAPAPAHAEELDDPAAIDAVDELKVLPPPPMPKEEAAPENPKPEPEEKKHDIVQQSVEMAAPEAVVADFLNLEADAPPTDHHSDSLALALFDGGETKDGAVLPPWEAFKEAADWEKAIVESASSLEGQKPELAGGFNMLMLDGMYSQGKVAAAAGDGGVSGSASSMAVGNPAGTGMLALPAPVQATSGDGSGDPFAASSAVAPPPWVQISEMERKQRLLVEEQLMWQQYAKDGMQGKLPGATGGAAYPYTMGGYTQRL